MTARAASAALAALLFAGCQATGANPPAPTFADSTTPPASTLTSRQTGTTAAPKPATMPLVLAVHATRPVTDVSVAAARKVVASGGTRWSAIGQRGGRMRVLSTKDRSAADVLRAVQSNPNVLGIVPADAVNARVRVLTVGGRHPLREPQRYPLHTPSTRPLPEITTITAVGDIMLGRRVGDRQRADPGAPLKPLAKRLASAEITVGNFESTLSTAGSPTQGGDSFAASPRPDSIYFPWPTTTSATTGTALYGRPCLASPNPRSALSGRDGIWPRPAGR